MFSEKVSLCYFTETNNTDIVTKTFQSSIKIIDHFLEKKFIVV